MRLAALLFTLLLALGVAMASPSIPSRAMKLLKGAKTSKKLRERVPKAALVGEERMAHVIYVDEGCTQPMFSVEYQQEHCESVCNSEQMIYRVCPSEHHLQTCTNCTEDVEPINVCTEDPYSGFYYKNFCGEGSEEPSRSLAKIGVYDDSECSQLWIQVGIVPDTCPSFMETEFGWISAAECSGETAVFKDECNPTCTECVFEYEDPSSCFQDEYGDFLSFQCPSSDPNPPLPQPTSAASAQGVSIAVTLMFLALLFV